ncbi:ATP-binding protein [Streptomyces sp. CRN 30]|uniref:ATP-binding protein n=1 Tax=Streptomyces sp. CRN 30 TaxID=3075613 RepID=UPI002A82FE99|nr:ATP-binding protein [Streptomyces sp. CRN 30]
MTGSRDAGTATPSYTETLPCLRQSAEGVRRLISTALRRWGMTAAVDTVALVASELATNAILHSGRPSFRIRISRTDARTVKVLVSDRNRQVPVVRGADTIAEDGRGLLLVDKLSAGWGYDRTHWGKTVWAIVKVPPA